MTYGVLKGLRVLDLGIITAGASTSAILADLGAEVLKVEGPTYTDSFREWSGRADSATWWNESPQFNATNRNKKSVCLDLKAPVGHELFLQLVQRSDIVVENFRAGTLDRLGLGFQRLRDVNPAIIVASISSQGASGPNADNVSYGSTLEASSGMASLMRYPGETPKISGRALNYPDQVVSIFAAGAILAAIAERLRTGAAIHLDLSQRELTAWLVGESLVSSDAETAAYPVGPPAEIKGVFRSSDGYWVAITLAGSALLAGSEPASWVAARAGADAVREIRAAGGAAELVRAARGPMDPDPVPITSAFGIDSLGRGVKGCPVQLGGERLTRFEAVQGLGSANEYAATTILKLTDDEYRSLAEQGIFTDRPGVRRVRVRPETAKPRPLVE